MSIFHTGNESTYDHHQLDRPSMRRAGLFPSLVIPVDESVGPRGSSSESGRSSSA